MVMLELLLHGVILIPITKGFYEDAKPKKYCISKESENN